MTSLNIESKTLKQHIEIIEDKFYYANREVERIEQQLQAAIENRAMYKRELDLAKEQERSLTRKRLSSEYN